MEGGMEDRKGRKYWSAQKSQKTHVGQFSNINFNMPSNGHIWKKRINPYIGKTWYIQDSNSSCGGCVGKDRITVQWNKLSELKMIISVFLLQNQNRLEEGSKNGTQSRTGSKTDCKSFDLQKTYPKKELDDLRTLY